MASSRVPPVPPEKNVPEDKTAPAPHRRIVKVEKISKVSEIDEDQTRARKFREMVEQPEAEEEETTLPTPFMLFAREDRPFEEMARTAIPSTAHSPPPSASLGGTAEELSELPPPPSPPPPLPQSRKLWAEIDEPPDTERKGPTFRETSPSANRSFPNAVVKKGQEEKEEKAFSPLGLREKEEREKKGLRPTAKEPSPFGPPGKPVSPVRIPSKAEEEEFLAFGQRKEKGAVPSKIQEGPLGPPSAVRPMKKGEEKRGISPPFPEKRAEQKAPKSEAGAEKKKPAGYKPQPMPPPSKKEEQIFAETKKEEEKGKREKKKTEEAPLQIQSPSLTPLLTEVIPVAQAAAAAATPYLGPEALAIYFHMVGTIVAMVSPTGDTRTEFILNAPSFANSKFFGATITIEKFRTAPDSLNIRLTGSTQAVNAFNQNIPNLLAAFQKGRFSFVVNRIETAYERPLFQRKEPGRGKGEKGFGEGFKRGKR